MNIKPFAGKIHIKLDKPSAGGLDLSSKPTAVEYAEVIGVSIWYIDTVKQILKVGDKIFVKAWGIDVITHNGETYYFVDADSKAICATVTDD